MGHSNLMATENKMAVTTLHNRELLFHYICTFVNSGSILPVGIHFNKTEYEYIHMASNSIYLYISANFYLDSTK